MPTVTVRFEKCRKVPSRGVVYYRIYKGHNTRMEFTSNLKVMTTMWDEEKKTVKGDTSRAKRIRDQIEADLTLLNSIIEEDAQRCLSMKDIKEAFRKKRILFASDETERLTHLELF